MLKRRFNLVVSIFVAATDSVVNFLSRLVGGKPKTCMVLAYHSVPAEERELFAKQMDVLKRVATPVPANVAALPDKAGRYVAITFDDGLETVFDNALPELRKRGIHSTLFIVPEVLGGHPNWEFFDTPDPSVDQVMTVKQLQEIPTDLVEIGSHSMTHPVLPKVDDEGLRRELIGSREALEKMLNREIKLFSFPYGAFDDRVAERCREAKYDRIFSALPVPAFVKPQEFLTGRVGVVATDWPIEFRLKVMGAYRWLPYAYELKRKVRAAISPRTAPAAALNTEEKEDRMTLTESQGRVIEVLLDVFKSKGLSAPPLGPETVLDQIGLESLDFAQAVIRLEEITGKDPFATGAEYQIKSLSDLAVLYD